MPDDCDLKINWGVWNELPIFDLIRKTGDVPEEEMRIAFNLGIGMILVCRKENVDIVMEKVKVDNPIIIGEIIDSVNAK